MNVNFLQMIILLAWHRHSSPYSFRLFDKSVEGTFHSFRLVPRPKWHPAYLAFKLIRLRPIRQLLATQSRKEPDASSAAVLSRRGGTVSFVEGVSCDSLQAAENALQTAADYLNRMQLQGIVQVGAFNCEYVVKHTNVTLPPAARLMVGFQKRGDLTRFEALSMWTSDYSHLVKQNLNLMGAFAFSQARAPTQDDESLLQLLDSLRGRGNGQIQVSTYDGVDIYDYHSIRDLRNAFINPKCLGLGALLPEEEAKFMIPQASHPLLGGVAWD